MSAQENYWPWSQPAGFSVLHRRPAGRAVRDQDYALGPGARFRLRHVGSRRDIPRG